MKTGLNRRLHRFHALTDYEAEQAILFAGVRVLSRSIVANALRAGADANEIYGPGLAMGMSPLISVLDAKNAPKRRARMGALLLTYGADVNRACCEGTTALHVASTWGNVHAVRVLLDGGANIDAQDRAGNTPLFIAVTVKPFSRACVELLLSRKANRWLKNEDGRTAVEAAVMRSGIAGVHLTELFLGYCDAPDGTRLESVLKSIQKWDPKNKAAAAEWAARQMTSPRRPRKIPCV